MRWEVCDFSDVERLQYHGHNLNPSAIMLFFGYRTSSISDFMRKKVKFWFNSSLLMLARLNGPKAMYCVGFISVYLIVNGNKT